MRSARQGTSFSESEKETNQKKNSKKSEKYLTKTWKCGIVIVEPIETGFFKSQFFRNFFGKNELCAPWLFFETGKRR